jgi:hypothetical protein
MLLAWLIPLGVYAQAPTEVEPHRLLVFEGSDWCANCIRLEKQVLTDSSFVAFTQAAGLTVERIDFPQSKPLDKATRAHNRALAEQYHFEGQFPTLVLVNGQTGTVSRMSYSREDVGAFTAQLRAHLSDQP